jgi:murein DD-endopeptidase MepM/ murein hydrolase activator NlpD
MQYPLASFTFTQSFGCSPYWFEPWSSNLGCNYHNGIDLAAPMGAPVYAADGGVIDQAGWCDCGLGYYVRIDHGNGERTLYGHLSEYFYGPGTPVSKGEHIANVGSTGNSTGPHVHFIVNINGVDYDPLWYLP